MLISASAVLSGTQIPNETESSAGPAQLSTLLPEFKRLIETTVASWESSPKVLQTRSWHRIQFRKPILMTPLDEQTHRPAGESQVVTGRDISLGGLSFIHTEPVAHRMVAITFLPETDLTALPESVVMNLTWCRYCQDGVLLSGGSFVREIELNLTLPYPFAPSAASA